MSVLTLILILTALAVVQVFARRMPETSQPIKTFIVWGVIILAVYLILDAVGIIAALARLAVPKV